MNLGLELALALMALTARAAPQYVTHCPGSTRPSRTVDPLRPWVCILPDEHYRTGMECPHGSQAVTTADRYDPFKCALREVYLQAPKGVCPQGHRPIPSADPTRDYECEKIGAAFMSGPGCPKGSRPVPTPGALAPFRCVSGADLGDAEPSAEAFFPGSRRKGPRKPDKAGTCPKGTERVASEDPFAPVLCEPPSKQLEGLHRGSFSRYRVPGQVSFEYPRHWHLTDAWRDEPPSLLVLLDTQRDGKPVSLSITRHRKDSPSYEPMDSLIWREKNWRDAKEDGARTVGGLRGVKLTVPRESSTIFLPSGDGFYVISYSAPADLYAKFLPAFDRLLESFTIPATPGGIR